MVLQEPVREHSVPGNGRGPGRSLGEGAAASLPRNHMEHSCFLLLSPHKQKAAEGPWLPPGPAQVCQEPETTVSCQGGLRMRCGARTLQPYSEGRRGQNPGLRGPSGTWNVIRGHTQVAAQQREQQEQT